jgi:hypothetical protein
MEIVRRAIELLNLTKVNVMSDRNSRRAVRGSKNSVGYTEKVVETIVPSQDEIEMGLVNDVIAAHYADEIEYDDMDKCVSTFIKDIVGLLDKSVKAKRLEELLEIQRNMADEISELENDLT